jgi:hypothetical protein
MMAESAPLAARQIFTIRGRGISEKVRQRQGRKPTLEAVDVE